MSGCALTICRGCCCGTDDRKRAAARVDYLRQRLHAVELRTSGCLGPCDRRDVIVVHPHARHRTRGQGPIWLERMHTKNAMDELIGWLDAGGPGEVLMPVELAHNAFRPPARSKRSRRVG